MRRRTATSCAWTWRSRATSTRRSRSTGVSAAGGTTNVGIVLQAYLYRSESDLESLLELEPNVRVCKGAYLEPPEIAYPEKQDVDAAYVRLLELALRRAGFVGIATHDERMIEHAIAFVARERIPGERFQFQMLYGVRPQLQLSLVRRGYPVLVATPYGPDWYRYLMRRLAERPANIGFLLRNLVRAKCYRRKRLRARLQPRSSLPQRSGASPQDPAQVAPQPRSCGSKPYAAVAYPATSFGYARSTAARSAAPRNVRGTPRHAQCVSAGSFVSSSLVKTSSCSRGKSASHRSRCSAYRPRGDVAAAEERQVGDSYV